MDWIGSGSVPSRFGLDWNMSDESISYSGGFFYALRGIGKGLKLCERLGEG